VKTRDDNVKRGSRLGSALILALLAFVAVAATGASAAPHHAKVKGGKVIVFPKGGEVVNGNVAKLSIRSGRGLRVRLNGRWIPAKEFGRARRGVRTMQASLSYGLRAGTNTLTVKLRRHGQRQRATVRFIVNPPAPMAGAGRDQVAATGGDVVLAGQIEPGAPTREAIEWTPIRVPEAVGNDCPAPRSTTVLRSPDGLTASLRPQAPGTYVYRMTAREGGKTVSDTVQVDTSSPNRMVPIETMIGSGAKAGIKVGRYTYLLSEAGGASGSGLQVLVLSRHNLECISNTRYAKAAEAQGALKQLDSSKLVIVAAQPGVAAPGLDGKALYEALGEIGFPTEKDQSVPVAPGSLSGIGNVGLARGEADVDLLPGGSAEPAKMVGYLLPDQYNNFGFVPSQSEPFSLLSRGNAGCKTEADCESKAGFYLRVLDARTLAPGPSDKTFFPTGAAAHSTQTVTELAEALEKVPAGDIVELESRSERPRQEEPGREGYIPPVGPIDKGLMVRFANAIAAVGGTKNAINKIARLRGDVATYGLTYALVGWKGAAEGEAAESAQGVDGVGITPGLAGLLRPNQRSLMRPAEESAFEGPRNLSDVVMEAPNGDWPLAGDAGAMKAFDYLGSTDRFEKLGEDPRKAYWSLDLEFTQWRNIAAEFKPAAGKEAEKEEQRRYEEVPKEKREGFTLKQYEAAKAELWQELEWVATTREYLHRLSQPFAENGLKSYVTVQEIGDKIYKESNASDSNTSLEWVEFTSIMLKLAGPLTLHATNTLGELLDLGVWAFGSTPEGRPTYDGVQIKAHELGSALMKQMESTIGTYRAMGDVIVSDPKKLAEVGKHGGCNPEKGSCPSGFAFNEEDKLQVSAGLSRSVQRLSYERLVPLAYEVFKLRHQKGPETTPPDPQKYTCGIYHPWSEFSKLAREQASATLLQELDPKGGQNGYQVLMQARPPGSAQVHAEAPPDAMLEKMYKPVPADNNANVGGLGMSPEELLGSEEWTLWAPNNGENPPNDSCYWEP
jgi:hypothetical protein